MAIPKQVRVLNKPTTDGQGNAEVVGALALQIVISGKIQLSRVHVSRVADQANARSEALAQMFGYLASRSRYADGSHAPAPGGKVMLDVRMLRSIIELSRYYTVCVAEFAGGCHSTDAHYRGAAFDVNCIDGLRVGMMHPKCKDFMQACRELGAVKVFGPPDAGHSTHIHAQWT
jgi:hypothetical protein